MQRKKKIHSRHPKADVFYPGYLSFIFATPAPPPPRLQPTGKKEEEEEEEEEKKYHALIKDSLDFVKPYLL
jgi:hypothetical protein